MQNTKQKSMQDHSSSFGHGVVDLTKLQRNALEKFPVGEWCKCPFGIHISTLNSLIKRGLLRHRTDDDIPIMLGVKWTQPLKFGMFFREGEPRSEEQ